MNEEPRPPRQREIPRYAPVVFDDTEDDYADDPYDDYTYEGYDDPADQPPLPPPPRPPRRRGRGPGDGGDDEGPRGPGRSGRGGRGPGDYASDAGLLRVMALIAFLGLVIVALVLPWSPISVVGGGGGDGDGDIATEARGDLPNLPPGLVALSKMYDISIPEGMEGPWTIEVRLDDRTTDPSNLAYYSYDQGQWQRLVSVDLAEDGTRVAGVLSEAPGSIAVLRREATAAELGLLLDAGETPDPVALNGAGAVAVRAATVDATGAITINEGGAAETRSGSGAVPVYLGVTGPIASVLGADATIAVHAEAIAEAITTGQYAGAYLEYTDAPAAGRDAMTSLVEQLSELLGEEANVIVGVPVDGAGAYDWGAVLDVARIWLHAPDDPTVYYPQVEDLLREQFSAGSNLSRVSLVLDRRSTQLTGAGLEPITQREALTPASAVDRGIEGGITPGDPVTLRAVNLETNPGGAALQWDPETRTVTYSFSDDGEQRTIWIENRFSVGFRMEVAQRFGLGGIVVEPAEANAALPAVWESVIAFIEEGAITLEQPFGPYLVPCWQASDGEIEGASECWQEAEAAEAVVWRAPNQPGAYDIRLVVSDGTIFVAQELALNVQAEATPEPTPEATEEPEPVETEEPEPVETEEPEPTLEPEPEEPEPTTEPESDDTEDVPPGPAGDNE